MQGLAQMKQGFSTQLFGVLKSVGEPAYSIEDRSRMLSALEANLAEFKRVLPQDQLKELSVTLERLEPTFSRDSERKLIQSMRRNLGSP